MGYISFQDTAVLLGEFLGKCICQEILYLGKNMIGQTLNGYCIEAELAATSTGIVYKARHVLLQVFRAIKIIHPQLLTKDVTKKRVYLALEAWAKLEHPAFSHIFEALDTPNVFGFAMDYIAGNTLREILQNHGKLGISQAIDYFIQIAKALSFAHSQQILHRKLSPENIKIRSDETIKILGLGASRISTIPKITPENLCVGKVKYMAPEQFQGNYSIHSDQYALGIMLYEMVTGQVPFQAKNLADLYKMHVLESPVSPKNINGEITNDLQKIILRMLAKTPQERFPSLTNVIDAISEATDRIDFSNDVSLASLMSRGRSALERRNLDNAIHYFNKVLSLYGISSPESHEAVAKRAQASIWKEEEEDIRQIRDLNIKALAYFDDNKLDQARECVTEMLEFMRRHPDSSRIRGIKMDLMYEMPDLVQPLIQACESRWNKSKINLENAQKLLGDGQYQEAVYLLEEALEYDANNQQARFLLAEAKLHLDIIQSATYYREGIVHWQEKRYESSVACLQKVVSLTPSNTTAVEYLRRAKDEWEKEKQLQKKIDDLYQKARDFYDNGNYQDASENLERLLEILPEHSEATGMLEQLRERLEDDQRIEQIGFFYNKGHEFLKEKKWKEAVACFNKVLRVMPSHRNALHFKKMAEEASVKDDDFQQIFSNGISLFQSNQYRSALEKFDYLAQCDPVHTEVRKYRRLCLEFIAESGE